MKLVGTDEVIWYGDEVRFQNSLLAWYRVHGRHDMAWRVMRKPYAIFVSEVMLQQTQVNRVEAKFTEFLAAFPTVQALAEASLRAVLGVWCGLGYNRRGLMLQQAAQTIMQEHRGMIPVSPEILETLPGIGPNTAGSIAAFAYGHPSVFVETNIRTVFIHCCMQARNDVTDQEIRKLVEQTLYRNDPRTWYYALMDYGAYLKRRYPNPSRRSKHYTRQSSFAGSDRRIRGMIVRWLTVEVALSLNECVERSGEPADRVARVLNDLVRELIVARNDGNYEIKKNGHVTQDGFPCDVVDEEVIDLS